MPDAERYQRIREDRAAAVTAGVAVLDRVRPGWASEIDLEYLDIDNGRECVLGQIYGSYIVGLKHLDAGYADVRARSSFVGNDYRAEWRRVITARQNALGKAA